MYYKASDYYKEIFKEKVYKISLDGGMSCPNRDKNKRGGCIFCSSGGSGDFSIKYNGNIKTQIDDAIKFIEHKKTNKFIAYFQSYTNTFESIEYLTNLYTTVIEDDRIIALSIATRPDSISDECFELLDKLNKRKKVFIELGLQTSSNITAKMINRGYETIKYIETCKRLKRININIITHVIIGLPNETEADLINTINLVNEYSDGVKFQLLHVLKDTKLEKMYENNEYNVLTKDEYIELLSIAIKHLKPDIVVHRVTGDGPKNLLIAPLYSLNKKDMLNSIYKYFKNNNINQGSDYNK